jgi:hypothetical protein
MPYIPYIPLPPVNFAMGGVTGYTNGAFTVPTYNLELNEIAKQINLLQYQFSGAALYDVGSASASMSATTTNLGIIAENVVDLLAEVRKLNLNIRGISNSVEVSTKGLANISSHMGKQSVLTTMLVNDQIKNNEFQQQTTNQALADSGKPPTVVTPAAFSEKAKQVINDVSTTNALVAGTTLVQETITNAATTAFATTTTWIAESAFGVWITDAYSKTEIAVVALFSEAKAKALADKARLKTASAKVGGG